MARAFAALAAMLGFGPGAASALEAGDPAPPFTLQGSDGESYALSQFVGKRGVVLAWFPKAFTPG